MTNVLSANEQKFEDLVLSSEEKVVVDFYTPTCPPCQMMAPIVDQVAEELSDTLKVFKVDASKNQSLTEKYRVNSVPTFILIEGGEVKKSRSGVIPPAQLKNWIELS